MKTSPLSSAVISPCTRFRYELRRTWDESKPIAAWLMLNPSTADATRDDATIRVCTGYATRWGYGGLVVVNLFAFRATEPKELLTAADPIGPDNEAHLLHVLTEMKPAVVVCAFGDGGQLHRQGFLVAKMLRDRGIALHCLELTQAGYPVHPLRKSRDLTPVRWWPSQIDLIERPLCRQAHAVLSITIEALSAADDDQQNRFIKRWLMVRRNPVAPGMASFAGAALAILARPP